MPETSFLGELSNYFNESQESDRRLKYYITNIIQKYQINNVLDFFFFLRLAPITVSIVCVWIDCLL